MHPLRYLIVGLVLALPGCDGLIDAELARRWDPADYSLLESGDLHLVLVGTGLPIPDPERLPASTAILADGEFLLVDAGPGAIRQADLLELPVKRLSVILLTHFHSDHIGGLGEALASSWFRGRENRVEVYGPPGTRRVVEGFLAAYAFDTEYRSLPRADELEPRWMEPTVTEVAVTGEEAVQVFARGALRVSAFAVDHSPVAPAYGYRVDYRGRSVVISGDTRGYAPLARHAKGADVQVHVAVGMPDFLRERAIRLQERGLLPRVDPELLASPLQAAAVARDAGVAQLVFSHVLPINNFILRWIFLRGVDDVYDGDVVVGRDGMRFDLEAEAGF